jgi:hypothetical protein
MLRYMRRFCDGAKVIQLAPTMSPASRPNTAALRASSSSCLVIDTISQLEEIAMLPDRRHLLPIVLALLSIAVGFALLSQAVGLAIHGRYLQLPALLLIVYGLVVMWWHLQRSIGVFEVRTARAVQRALRAYRR